jgi:hypothetical protein
MLRLKLVFPAVNPNISPQGLSTAAENKIRRGVWEYERSSQGMELRYPNDSDEANNRRKEWVQGSQ